MCIKKKKKTKKSGSSSALTTKISGEDTLNPNPPGQSHKTTIDTTDRMWRLENVKLTLTNDQTQKQDTRQHREVASASARDTREANR